MPMSMPMPIVATATVIASSLSPYLLFLPLQVLFHPDSQLCSNFQTSVFPTSFLTQIEVRSELLAIVTPRVARVGLAKWKSKPVGGRSVGSS
ncbi:hypothetical protein BJX66DRAFT_163924 [Aspergillus keveii]|uniref:Secreted protein n=1 Tax=Aspergillus keveii TaxID=714993 RepID=A0ABR4G9X1_9EURO